MDASTEDTSRFFLSLSGGVGLSVCLRLEIGVGFCPGRARYPTTHRSSLLFFWIYAFITKTKGQSSLVCPSSLVALGEFDVGRLLECVLTLRGC